MSLLLLKALLSWATMLWSVRDICYLQCDLDGNITAIAMMHLMSCARCTVWLVRTELVQWAVPALSILQVRIDSHIIHFINTFSEGAVSTQSEF